LYYIPSPANGACDDNLYVSSFEARDKGIVLASAMPTVVVHDLKVPSCFWSFGLYTTS